MKKIKIILFLCSFHLAGIAQDLDYAKRIVLTLSSPDFKGRGYIENGDKLSAELISSEFQNLGLEPVFKKSYFQKFKISVNTFPDKLSVRIDETELKPGIDFLIESPSPSINGKFNIIKASRNQIDTESKLISLAKSAGDAFIMIDNTQKTSEKPEDTKRIDEYIDVLKYSPELNIKGIIIQTSEKLTWDISPVQGPRPVVVLAKDINADAAKTIDITIDAKLLSGYETQNVAGSIKGTAATDSMIVVLAHYDHLGKMGKDTYFPGANDNASGVAMILDLAKYYSVNKPKYTMVFVALAAEEPGLLGAKAFTDNPPFNLKKIKFLVNFDLAGTGDDGIKVVNGSVYKDKFDLLTKLNKEEELLPKIDIRGAACNSDHCLFYEKGVPCFYIYTLGGIQAYHDVYDKYETLPFTRFGNYCKLMIAFFNQL